MFRKALLALALALALPGLAFTGLARAADVGTLEGWAVHETAIPYDELIDRLKEAVKAEGLIVVTQAGPTEAAARRGITIPGNRVLGVFNNDYAVRVIGLSVAAMIEAPIRFYVTEEEGGASTLSYKTPSFVFAPYLAEGGAELEAIAAELDARFAAIAARAVSR